MSIIASISIAIYLAIGAYSLLFYVKDFVIPVTEEKEFEYDMLIVMFLAMFVWPVFWLMRLLVNSAI